MEARQSSHPQSQTLRCSRKGLRKRGGEGSKGALPLITQEACCSTLGAPSHTSSPAPKPWGRPQKQLLSDCHNLNRKTGKPRRAACYSLTGLGGLVSQERMDSQVTETVTSLLQERGAPASGHREGKRF